ncbi:MAG: right-handed parallel beta-helix repeat-containing protein [Sedimentisphaerales bacterium]|nr:right-handed parallel beta-helix repeat-containing protein [Sedimentisphaerales bacterium]
MSTIKIEVFGETMKMQTKNWKTRSAVLCFCLSIASVCPAKVIYVDDDAAGANDGSTWADAYYYLQDALMFAVSGDEIRVAKGIYKPDQGAAVTQGNRSAKFGIINGLTIMGAYAGYGEFNPDERDTEEYETFLSGDLSGNDADTNDLRQLAGDPTRAENIYQVVYAENLDANTILDGLTICGGVSNSSGSGMSFRNSSPKIINCTFTRNSGYAAYIREESNPSFTDCTFIENASFTSYSSYGGGMLIGDYCAPMLVNCTFERNFRYGIRNYGNPELTNCTFAANDYIGIWNDGAYADEIILTNCVFTGNLGNAVSNNNCSPLIQGCAFIGNSGSSGAAIYNGDGAPLIVNCTFQANHANYGGAIRNSGAGATLINCTFIGNSAAYSGGAIRNTSSETRLVNCTFTGNSAYLGGAICNDWEASVEIVNSILWGDSARKGPEIAQADSYYTPHTPPLKTVIEHSNVQGGSTAIYVPSMYMRYGSPIEWGYGNIVCDPLFAEPDGADHVFGTEDDDVRLLPGSPCIDSGDDFAVPSSILFDLDGDARIAGAAVDMGAYEGPDQAFILSTRSLPVPEGSTAEFTVALAMNPNGPLQVSVAVHSGDGDITVVSGMLLEFNSSNYRMPQPVVLAAAEDPDRFTGTALIYVTALGLGTAGLTASEEENERYPDTLLVDAKAQGVSDGSDWLNAFTDLHEAINAANAIPQFKQIWVARGTYRPASPSGDRAVSFQLVNGLAIMGGYEGLKDRGRPGDEPGSDARDTVLYETILSGDLNGDDLYVSDPCDLMVESTRNENSYHVVTAFNCNGTALIDGFTITGGNANGSESSIQAGGGIYGGRPTVSNCRIVANSATNYAGGIAPSSYYSDYDVNFGVVKDSVISGNAAASVGGIAFSQITGCVIKNNCAVITGSGAAAIGTATDCTFENNSTVGSGGVISAWNESPVFIRCSFIGNSAAMSGGVLHVDGCGTCSDSYPDFQQCRFIGNSAGEYGGAVYSTSNSSVTFTNCLLVENRAGLSGGAICDVSYLGGTLVNSILWNNCTGPDANQCDECDVIDLNMNFCCVQGWTDSLGGDGNTGADPLFVGAEYGNFQLSPGSPCIDAGNNAVLPQATILDGDCNDTAVIDMGAYEFDFTVFGDIAVDCSVDASDFALLSAHWMESPCNEANNFCDLADIDRQNGIDFRDVLILAQNWLTTTK